jgi:signal transduction histidine kinase
MRRRRVPLSVIWPIALLLLVGLLASLQYRWLGQVSEAERAQLLTSLRAHAQEFADDFDREILQTYVALQAGGTALQQGDWTAFADRYDTWHASTRYPQIVRDVFFLRGDDSDRLLQYAPDRRTFADTAWPADLAVIHDRLAGASANAGGAVRFLSQARDPIVVSVPALVISLPVVQTYTSQTLTGSPDAKRADERAVARAAAELSAVRTAAGLMSFHLGGGYIVVRLNRAYLQTTLLPELAARYFPALVTPKPHSLSSNPDGYRLAIVPADDPGRPVYSRGLAPGASIDPQHADANVSLLTLRVDLVDRILTRDQRTAFGTAFAIAGQRAAAANLAPPATLPSAVAAARLATAGQLSIIVRSATGPRSDTLRANVFASAAPGWQLLLQHSAGSLDAAVSEARRRNLTMSFGVLALLAVSVGLIMINAQRSQRLAAQQMDFVATVSHELRTPLAVIRSAAQNMSAGVIHDAAQAKRYGDLIDVEGKRLTDMVEQVLEFAGLSDNRRPLATRPVDPVSVVNDVLASCNPLLQSERIVVEVHAGTDVPPVAADEEALRRALSNLVTNAVKYGADGCWIGVSVERAAARGGAEVQITVSDRGRGIEAVDLPHIFEPFYRGRYALERQIHGNGLGLSLVKRIAEAHGGRVSVRSTPGEGATFTLHLPAADAAPDHG